MADFSEAKWYENNSPAQREDGLKMIKLVAPKKGDKILDFGCGTGYLSKTLADLVGPSGRVIAIDPDAERVQFAKKMHPASNLEYVIGSTEEIPGGEYDMIFSNHVLHYCEDKNATFKHFSTKLKPGGTFAFIACVEDDVNKYIQSLPELYGQKFRDAYASFFHYTSADEFKRITSANKFKVTYTEDLIVKYAFKGVNDLVDFHKTHIRGEYDESEFNIDAIRRHYGDNPFHLDYDYLLVISTYEV